MLKKFFKVAAMIVAGLPVLAGGFAALMGVVVPVKNWIQWAKTGYSEPLPFSGLLAEMGIQAPYSKAVGLNQLLVQAAEYHASLYLIAGGLIVMLIGGLIVTALDEWDTETPEEKSAALAAFQRQYMTHSDDLRSDRDFRVR